MHDDVDMVRGAYAAFARTDLPAILDAFDPDIELVVPHGWTPIAGTYRGWEDVLADVIERIPERWADFRIDPERFLCDGEYVVVLGRYRGRSRKGDQSLDVPFAHIWTMALGRAVRVEIYTDTATLALVAEGQPGGPGLPSAARDY